MQTLMYIAEYWLLISQKLCENISNEFQIVFETHFLLLETLLDINKLSAHFIVKTNSWSEY